MIEENRKRAQERKRKRDEAMLNETAEKPLQEAQTQKAVRFSEATAEDGARASKRIMENLGFAMAYSGNDDVIDINEEDLEDLEDEIEQINSQMDSQFNRKMKNDDEYYEYD